MSLHDIAPLSFMNPHTHTYVSNKSSLSLLMASKSFYPKLSRHSPPVPIIETKFKYSLIVCRIPHDEIQHMDTSAPHNNVKDLSVSNQKVDLRSKFPPPFDQGNLGSCTANALCGIISYDLGQTKNKYFIGSRLFLYYNERKLENDIPDDAGAQLSDGVKVLCTYGICPEAEWPYDVSKFASKPPDKCYEDATIHHAIQAKNIRNDLLSMKEALSNGYPFVVGIMIYDSFQSKAVALSGMVPMPSSHENCLGGHAVACVGFDDQKQVWIMRNSWGTNWGDRGYFYLPYAYLLNCKLASDLWCVTKMS